MKGSKMEVKRQDNKVRITLTANNLESTLILTTEQAMQLADDICGVVQSVRRIHGQRD